MTTNTDEAAAGRWLGRYSLKNEPNWITGDLGNYTSDANQQHPSKTIRITRQVKRKREAAGVEANLGSPFTEGYIVERNQANLVGPYQHPRKKFGITRQVKMKSKVAGVEANLGGPFTEGDIVEPKIEEKQQGPVQQSDLFKPLWMDIANYGLNFAFQKCIMKNPDPPTHSKTQKRKRVIVVGAGMAGLVAAYELEQVGHNVIVLESQTRVGGRVHTLGQKDGFAKNLHAEAGAMRLPCEPDAEDKTHFLTDFYASERFKLTLARFSNYSENAYLKFYDEEAVRVKEWDDATFSKLWPGWDATLKETGTDIKSIDEYYDCTTKVVTDQLLDLLHSGTVKKSDAWEEWIGIWSQFPLDGFLKSNYDAVKTKFSAKALTISPNSLEDLKKYLPWPDAAITAYSVFNYTEQLDQSLVQYLRDQLGQWWSPHMHCIQGGMSLLPEAFTEPNEGRGWNPNVHLHQKIDFNRTVKEIVYTFHESKPEENHVVVKGYFSNSRHPFQVEGDAIIVATPINILRQIRYTPSDTATQSPPQSFHKAIEGIFTGASTKLFIQTKTRFWEKEEINGGFSKTNLPIGQLHYPTNLKGEHPGEKGILLVYTWKTEALLFGSLDPTTALHEAVEQIATIHPEIKEQVETGAVCAWYNQSNAQGAYALLKPTQYQNVRYLLEYPMGNIFFAGEGLSFASGWIQGALESGLRAAFQFYIRNEKDWKPEDK